MIEEKNLRYRGAHGAPVIRELGNAVKSKTGLWRTERPVCDLKKCIKCKLCWLYCPESCIRWREEGPSWDFDTCKGCLICVSVCPAKAISAEKEC